LRTRSTKMIDMRIFRRSESSGSSSSRTSSISDYTTPRTSIDGEDLSKTITMDDLASNPQEGPLLALPIELVQHVASYLDTESTASFCLASRYTYYALGSDRLSQYVSASKSRFEKRKTIEAVVERAFPGHWFCAWCDKFHAWTPSDGPTTIRNEKKRDCADFNSYLHHGKDFVLTYHHIRLAINRASRGAEHGIPLSAFSHTTSAMASIYKTPVPTNLTTLAKIVDGTFLLHTSFAIILPSWTTRKKTLLTHLWPVFPHVLSGHRDSPNGHTGLMAAIDNTVRRNWQYLFTQTCANCTTDWVVSCHHFPHATGGQARLVVQTWRDLGDARNPFDSQWRAHGVCSGKTGDGGCIGKDRVAGDVRRKFDMGGERVRSVSPTRERLYTTFMRRGREDEGGVRRSRARPQTWRTRSENEEVFRREEEERVEVARQVAESLVRLDAEREW
jgi:hypothetical protein